MTDSTEIRPIDEPINTEIVNIRRKVTIEGNRFNIKSTSDAIELWNDFVADYWKSKLITALPGNRNSVMQKLNLFKEFIQLEQRTQDDFDNLAMGRGFNTERRAELWQEFQYFFTKEFKAWISSKLNPPAPKPKQEGIIL